MIFLVGVISFFWVVIFRIKGFIKNWLRRVVLVVGGLGSVNDSRLVFCYFRV